MTKTVARDVKLHSVNFFSIYLSLCIMHMIEYYEKQASAQPFVLTNRFHFAFGIYMPVYFVRKRYFNVTFLSDYALRNLSEGK